MRMVRNRYLQKDNAMDKKVILITGASSGIGYDAALGLAKRGHRVYGAARRVEKMAPLKESGVVPVRMDVTDEESVVAGVKRVLEAEGRIDVLINNAGFGYLGAIENVPLEEARKQLDVNLFGLARLTQLVLPSMREQGAGRIINVSSVAGKATILFGGWYNVSKYAVEAFSDALRAEVEPLGIQVTIIEPSGINTPWGGIAADHLEESSKGTAYERPGLRMAKTMRWGFSTNYLSGPHCVTKAFLRAVSAKRKPCTRYRPGRGAYIFLFLHAVFPARWWDAFIRLLGK